MTTFFIFRFQQEDYERRQRELGAVAFTPVQLSNLLPLWTPAELIGQSFRAATFQLPSGSRFRVAPDFIQAPAELSHDFHRAAVRHAETLWGGKTSIAAGPRTDPQARLWARAYAEVYGIELDDANELCGRPLSREMLDRLPALRQEIRATHADAPPARPDEAQQLAAMYARRYPFRVAQAA